MRVKEKKIIIEPTNHEAWINSRFYRGGDYADEVDMYLKRIWYQVFQDIIHGKVSIAYYKFKGKNGSTWTYAFHKSTKHKGIQMSFFETTKDGNVIPTSHSDFIRFADMTIYKDGITLFIRPIKKKGKTK